MASFTYVRQVAAPPEIVFDVLTDHRRYTEITPLRRAELEREGEPAPNGLGAIRVLAALPGPPMREEVIAYERILMRTAEHADLLFNQFFVGIYIGDGSPVDQVMWVDDLTVAAGR